jgi:hypothetical protein
MEHEKVVVKRPHTFAEESKRRGTKYYDYENNINIVPRYAEGQVVKAPTTYARGRSAEGSIARFFHR